LNELGLDPGIDHLAAVKTIQEVQAEGGQVDSFVSWCGGLPAPEASDNPFGYKFSWSPKGVLLAATNAAKYIENGKTIEISGDNLLKTAKSLTLVPGLNFEGLANRDSTKYIEQYGLKNVKNMFRGTLRYKVREIMI
jgi:saccharopine dehydrogenase-like NADP-dependent oxidoreductase